MAAGAVGSRMKVLVTGSEGYVGSALMPLLQASGYDARGVDSCLFEDAALDGAELREADGPWLRADYRDLRIADLVGFDAVVHLAGLSNDPLGDLDPALTERINHVAASAFAELCAQAGVARFVFASSCSVYGAGGEDVVDEDSVCRPVTPYASSKLAAEREILALRSTGFSPVALRFATAYGASARMRFDLVINNLVAWACSTGRVLLKSDGSAWRPLVHIEDMATAIEAALAAPRERVAGACYNVGCDEENYRVRDVAGAIVASVRGTRLEFSPGASADRRSYRVSFARIARELEAWCPRWRAPAGIAEIERWCRRWQVEPDEFEGPRYCRVDHLRSLLDRGIVNSDLRRIGEPDRPPRPAALSIE